MDCVTGHIDGWFWKKCGEIMMATWAGVGVYVFDLCLWRGIPPYFVAWFVCPMPCFFHGVAKFSLFLSRIFLNWTCCLV